MTTSPDLGIVQLSQNQANPDITFNTAFITIQALLNGVIDKDLTAPPGSPAEGDAYLIASGAPTGAWSGHGKTVAIFWGGIWNFVPGLTSAGTPIVPGARNQGLRVYVRDEAKTYTWSGSAWVAGTVAASDVTFTPVGTIAATDVQAAIAEAASEAVQKSGDTMTGSLNVNSATATALHPKQTTSGVTQTDSAIVVESTDAGGNGPVQSLWHNSASPAPGDNSKLRFHFNNASAAAVLFAQVRGIVGSTTAAAETGNFDFGTVQAGGFATRLTIGAGVYTPNATGGDKGIDTLNVTSLYEAGTLLTAKYAQLGANNVFTGTYNVFNGGAGVPASPLGLTTLNVVGAAASPALSCVTGVGGVPIIVGIRFNGTIGIPTAVVSGDELGRFGSYGYDATATLGNGPYVVFKATQNWNNTSHGCSMGFVVVPNGSTTIATAITIDQDGGMITPGLGSLGTGTIRMSSAIRTGQFTVATLPSAATMGAGAMAFVTDGSAVPIYNAVATGGSTNGRHVVSDGTNWRNS